MSPAGDTDSSVLAHVLQWWEMRRGFRQTQTESEWPKLKKRKSIVPINKGDSTWSLRDFSLIFIYKVHNANATQCHQTFTNVKRLTMSHRQVILSLHKSQMSSHIRMSHNESSQVCPSQYESPPPNRLPNTFPLQLMLISGFEAHFLEIPFDHYND